jgi:primosomal replication protein N
MCLNSKDTLLCDGDRVIVLNHGDKWIHLARIVEINKVTSSAVVKWDTSLRKDTVDLGNCRKYDNEIILNRKRKATDFNQNLQVKKSKIRTSRKSEESLEQQRHLFPDKDEGQEIQFLGFVSSHRTGNVLNSFHIHSFAVFYTDKKEGTIVTCILTSRVYILSNMQDRVLQLMQLIQFWSNGNF